MSKTRDLANLADLNFDSGTMVVDKANDRVGVGTSSPSTYGGKLNIVDGSVGGETTLVVANNNANQFIRMGINADVAQIACDNADSLAFGIATDSTTSGLTTEHMRITAAGNVGIGSQTPSFKLAVEDGSGATRINVRNTANAAPGSGIYFEVLNGASVVGNGTIATQSNGDMAFFTGTSSGAERLRILPTGGITFNGDTAQANALDDYEEGTWTPKFTDHNGGDRFSSYNLQTGTYSKIGNTCFCGFDIIGATGAVTSGTYLGIGNLPFNVKSGSNATIVLNVGYMDSTGYSTIQGGFANTNPNFIFLVSSGSNYVGPGGLTNGSRMIGGFVYLTA